MKRIILCAAMLFALAIGSPAFAADCAPEKLMRIVTQNLSPGIPADSFGAKPKVMYRLGNGRLREEEQYDAEENVQLLSIVDAPRAWQIDLVAKTGETMVDDEVPPRLSAPVFSEVELPKEILAVEYGCEGQFMQDADTTHERLETKNGVAMKHSIRSGKWKLTLVTRENSEKPMAAMLSENDKVIGNIRYLSYQVLESVPDGLFTPPPGIAIKSMDLTPVKGTY
jgi:hypothetical protein